LTSLNLGNNQLTSFDGTGLGSLTALYLGYNQLTSFDGTELGLLTRLFLSNNQLSAITITDVNLSYNLYGMEGSGIHNNQLTEQALVDFLNALAPTTTGVINYGGNPGSVAFAAYLVTADDKGYIWINSAS
jgi:Leucine-rich repeat (LRR) protein